ncbi:hypothetical protein UFOVP1_41 [uncultured Caudovirales phage]|uniref:Uncharacterized protein n=1 Tax=uncultured Caudovirales phage TaxID=2100421 RepID=A0A6J5KHR4_9CAUD|nr:hypothetical protein UFOVP1_41 [uncultured Caudovirales phage]
MFQDYDEYCAQTDADRCKQLLYAIILSAIKDGDTCWLKSAKCEYYCYLIDLDYECLSSYVKCILGGTYKVRRRRDAGTRVCKSCRLALPTTDFYKERLYNQKGYYLKCKACVSKTNKRKYRQKIERQLAAEAKKSLI